MSSISLNDSFGAGYIGAMITSVLYGITTLQTYFYFSYYPNDGVGVKALVVGIWTVDTLHTGLVCHAMYYYLVSNYMNPEALAFGHWSLFISILLNLVVAVLVQSFFAMRIFHLIERPKLKIGLFSFIMLLVVAHFCFGLETVILILTRKELKKLSEITLIAALPFALFAVLSDVAVLSDIAIALALCILLWGSRTAFRRTNPLTTLLIIYAINRCLVGSFVAVIEILVFAIKPESLWFLAISSVIGKLYASSFLIALNERNSLRGKGLDTESPTSHVGTTGISNFHIDEKTTGRVRVNMSVNSESEVSAYGSDATRVRSTRSPESEKAEFELSRRS